MSKENYRGFRDLIVYELSYKLALEIFEITKHYPKEELYSLTDQIRRSSRSIPANISEAWRKRKYVKSFVSKLIDSLAEESETEVWLDFSKDLNYINVEKHKYFIQKYDEVARMLSSMIDNPDKFCH
ncbi:MAG: four helix bundle protein [Ignavibacteriaceae bacterium]|jgi:four helix bundle protein